MEQSTVLTLFDDALVWLQLRDRSLNKVMKTRKVFKKSGSGVIVTSGYDSLSRLTVHFGIGTHTVSLCSTCSCIDFFFASWHASGFVARKQSVISRFDSGSSCYLIRSALWKLLGAWERRDFTVCPRKGSHFLKAMDSISPRSKFTSYPKPYQALHGSDLAGNWGVECEEGGATHCLLICTLAPTQTGSVAAILQSVSLLKEMGGTIDMISTREWAARVMQICSQRGNTKIVRTGAKYTPNGSPKDAQRWADTIHFGATPHGSCIGHEY